MPDASEDSAPVRPAGAPVRSTGAPLLTVPVPWRKPFWWASRSDGPVRGGHAGEKGRHHADQSRRVHTRWPWASRPASLYAGPHDPSDSAARSAGRSGRTGRRPCARLPLLVSPGPDLPARRRRCRRFVLLGLRGQPVPRLHQRPRLHQHRLPAPEGRRRDPGAGGEDDHLRARVRRRVALRGRTPHRRAHPRRPRQDLLHQRWRRGRRERRPDGPAAHRPYEGAERLPLVPRRHRHRDQPHR